jgi:monofunctional biosynthetic peptidoglycan transglycosylase
MSFDNSRDGTLAGPSSAAVRRAAFWRRHPVAAMLAALFLLPVVVLLLYRVLPVPLTPLMVIRLVEGEGLSRHWVAYDRLSPNLRRAAIASEDAKFCWHHGFDWQAIEAAWREDQEGRRLRGGSTISQQTAKNLFLWPGGGYLRKAGEVYPTALMELLWPKRRILQTYLNIIEMGPGIYGAEAASETYFHRPAAALSAYQAALLIAVLPNPRRWSPAHPTPYIRARAATIMARMGDAPADCP